MIAKNNTNNQLPTEIKLIFKELNMFKHLRNAGIKKFVGYPCSNIFQLIFCLIFENKNWFQMLKSKKARDIPGKNTMYRFLNKSTFNWRRFLLLLAAHTIGKVS